MKKSLLVFILIAGLTNTYAQKSENSLLWKVSGNGLKSPSYLFGTFHFLANGFIDTLPAVQNAYKNATAIVGELVIDSTLQKPMLEASTLHGTTLQQLIPESSYNNAAQWLKSNAGIDLMNLNMFNPVTITTISMAIVQQKYFPNKPGETQLDTYFQQKGKSDGKQILGLETIDVQINALFKQLSLQRQAELFVTSFKNIDSLKNSIALMNKYYISQDLEHLKGLMYEGSYKPEEIKVLLDDRNKNWIAELPLLMKNNSLFVAVGALHLVGQNGLVNQLRLKGYTVTPVNLKNS